MAGRWKFFWLAIIASRVLAVYRGMDGCGAFAFPPHSFVCVPLPPGCQTDRALAGGGDPPSEKGRRSRATLSVLGSLCVASGRSEKVPCVYLHIEPYCRVVQGTNKRNQAQVTPYPVVTGFPGNFAAGQSYTPIPQPHFLFVFQNISKMK